MRNKTPNRRLHPLSPSQELTLMNWRFSTKRSIVNIPTSIIVEASLDIALLEVALRLCVQRWDMFGIRIVKVAKQWRQYFGERDVISLRRMDFRGRTPSQMKKFFEAEARKAFPLADSPMAKLYSVITPEGHTGVFSVMNHLIADSWAISTFYKDVFDVYRSLADGTAMPKPPHSSELVLVKELAYLKSDRFEADREYWSHDLLNSPPLYTSILGSRVLENYRRRSRKPEARHANTIFLRHGAIHTDRPISPEDVAACRTFLAEQGYPSMQLLFFLALRVFLAQVNGRSPDVTINATIARRGTLAEKRSGGSRVHSLTFRSIFDEATTFADALDALLTMQNTHYRHADFPYSQYSKLVHEKYGTRPGEVFFGLLFTFQPLSLSPDGGLRHHTMWHCNGALSIDCYLTIMDDDGTGGLRCYWEHRTARVKPRDIDVAQSAMMRVLRAGLANPDVTLGELMDLV